MLRSGGGCSLRGAVYASHPRRHSSPPAAPGLSPCCFPQRIQHQILVEAFCLAACQRAGLLWSGVLPLPEPAAAAREEPGGRAASVPLLCFALSQQPAESQAASKCLQPLAVAAGLGGPPPMDVMLRLYDLSEQPLAGLLWATKGGAAFA